MDVSDFGRCYRLLTADFAQGWAERISEMAVYANWAPLVPHWHELMRLFAEEKGLDRMPKTAALIRKAGG
jgi:hypothetical protein